MRINNLKCPRCHRLSLFPIDFLEGHSIWECTHCGSLYDYHRKKKKLYMKNLSAISDLYHTVTRLKFSDTREVDSIIHRFILRHKDRPMAITLLKKIYLEMEPGSS